MAENSAIEWTDHTFNPWTGCTKVSPGCDHCYAESWAKRSGTVKWGAGEPRRRTTVANWRKPIAWDKRPFAECSTCRWRGEVREAAVRDAPGESMHVCPACDRTTLREARQRVFCASLADVFDNEVDPVWRADLFALIDATPNLDWLLLTKRIGNVSDMLTQILRPDTMPLNVWLGATIVNQEEADRDIPKLLATPARVRFLSIEPLLGRVDLCEHMGMWWNSTMQCFESLGREWNRPQGRRGVDWVIVGGESGPGARPMHPEWARSLRDQCKAAGVPFLFKQHGEHTAGELAPHPDYPSEGSAWRLDQRGQRWNDPMEGLKPSREWAPVKFIKVGKKAAGRLLDGRTHDEFPC